MMKSCPDIDAYIKDFPADKQKLLITMRTTIQKAAPKAVEKISYGMPCFYQDGNLVYFAAMKNHIGFYPSTSGVANFLDELKPFHTSKGAIQFPLDKPLPLKLITAIVKFRVLENVEKAKAKKVKKICKNGHVFYKSSDCLTCPVCEKAKKPADGFLSLLGAPARRSLEAKGITSEKKLSAYTEKQIRALHGIGATAIPILKKALQAKQLNFKSEK
jgi:uncharacterized protein YdhG (YjbR/CyaY superfamily)